MLKATDRVISLSGAIRRYVGHVVAVPIAIDRLGRTKLQEYVPALKTPWDFATLCIAIAYALCLLTALLGAWPAKRLAARAAWSTLSRTHTVEFRRFLQNHDQAVRVSGIKTLLVHLNLRNADTIAEAVAQRYNDIKAVHL